MRIVLVVAIAAAAAARSTGFVPPGPVHTLSNFSPPLRVGMDADLVGPSFSLRAEITDWHSELRPIPEPGSLMGLALPLAWLAARGRRSIGSPSARKEGRAGRQTI